MNKLQPLIDFKELNVSVPGEDLESLVEALTERLGLSPEKSGRGADAGRDLILTQRHSDPLRADIRWLVSCKDHAASGKSVNEGELPRIENKLRQHNALGFLLVTTTVPSISAEQELKQCAANGNFFTDCWDGRRLEKMLLRPKNWDIFKQFFPQSYAKIRQLEGNCNDPVEFVEERFRAQTNSIQPMLIPGIPWPIPRSEVDEVEKQLELGKAVAVTGEAGTGKTGIAYALTRPRSNPDMSVLYLDVRKFCAVQSTAEIREEIGLKDSLTSGIRRMGSRIGCRVIIDQMDSVGSSKAGQIFVDLAVECAKLPEVQVVVLSRRQESWEERIFKQLVAEGFVESPVTELSDVTVMAIFGDLGIVRASSELVALGQNLLKLSLIAQVHRVQPDFDFSIPMSEIMLWESYLEALRQGEVHHLEGSVFGDRVVKEAVRLAREAVTTRRFMLDSLTLEQGRLKSWKVIEEDGGYFYRFYHEKLQDFLYAYDAVKREYTTENVIQEVDIYRTGKIFPLMIELYKRCGYSRLEEFYFAALGLEASDG